MPALLFDLDGTLVHTDALHAQAWQEILAEQGIELDAEGYRTRISGRTNLEIVRSLLPHLPVAEGMHVAGRKEARFRELVRTIQPVEGVVPLIERAARAGCGLALVTNAPRLNAMLILEALGLTDRFSVHVIAEELGVGKPDPRPYLQGLAMLGARPETSYAFEDSIPGVRSAVDAGLRVAGLCGVHTPESLIAAGATPVVRDFAAPALLQVLAPWLGAEA